MPRRVNGVIKRKYLPVCESCIHSGPSSPSMAAVSREPQSRSAPRCGDALSRLHYGDCRAPSPRIVRMASLKLDVRVMSFTLRRARSPSVRPVVEGGRVQKPVTRLRLFGADVVDTTICWPYENRFLIWALSRNSCNLGICKPSKKWVLGLSSGVAYRLRVHTHIAMARLPGLQTEDR